MPPSPPLTRRSTTSTDPPPPPPPPHATLPLPPDHPPPPPPPEPASSQVGSNASLKEIRKVGKTLGQNPIDYLLPYGSLEYPVSSYFHPTHDPHSLVPPPNETNKNPVAGIFGNLNYLLNSYLAVLEAGGSLAVGTGYQSVARKLLERVENLFGRNLGVDNVGWADVLEYLRGSRQKPSLFILPVRGILARREPKREEEPVLAAAGAEAAAAAAAAALEPSATTRELAESVVARVTVKPAMMKVEQWLQEVQQVLKASGSDESGGGVCAEKKGIEDEEDRMVCEIVEGILRDSMEDSDDQIKNFRFYLENRALIAEMRRALTRLYRDHPPEAITAPIVALYLLLHPELHPLLQALANIADSELELINSGKFDGFLDGSTNVVARDEDEELNVITNLDTRLRSVLEGLENEIEDLHNRALVVRRALKSRKECIIRRRPPGSTNVSSRSGSPLQRKSSGQFGKPDDADSEEQQAATSRRRAAADEDDWMLNVPTLQLPITPDDSASNISFNRRRRLERASKVNRDDDERHKEKERKREKKEARAKEKEEKAAAKGEKEQQEKEKEKEKTKEKEGKSPGITQLRFFPFVGKSSEVSPVDPEKSDDGETLTSKRRKRREKDGLERRDSHRDRSRNRERTCGECGSAVNTRDHEKKEGKKHSKDKKEERALKEVKEEKEKEKTAT